MSADTSIANDCVKVRQLASGVVHYAELHGLAFFHASVFGCDVTAITPPVASLCRSTLRQNVIRIPDLADDGYRVTCKACLLLSEARA